jgi:hypothetical protein
VFKPALWRFRLAASASSALQIETLEEIASNNQ